MLDSYQLGRLLGLLVSQKKLPTLEIVYLLIIVLLRKNGKQALRVSFPFGCFYFTIRTRDR